MNKVPLKRGQPKKLKRNLEICKLLDEEKMKLSELAEQYGKHKSRISQIINATWKEYIKLKHSGRSVMDKDDN